MALVAKWPSDLRRNYVGEPPASGARVGLFYAAVEISTGGRSPPKSGEQE
jgi:hypothetical protein